MERGGPKSNGWCPCKKRDIGQMHRERPHDDAGRDQGDATTNQKMPRIANRPQKLQEAGSTLLWGLQTKCAHPTSRFWASGLQNCERIHFSCWKPAHVWSFAYGSSRILTHLVTQDRAGCPVPQDHQARRTPSCCNMREVPCKTPPCSPLQASPQAGSPAGGDPHCGPGPRPALIIKTAQ